MEQQLVPYAPILIFLAVLLGFVTTVMVLAHLVGPRKQTEVKASPYESGMEPIGDARQHFDIKFYLIAVLFLVFDVELVLLYPWAVAAYADGGMPAVLARPVFVLVLLFLVKLTVAYAYEWRKGGFQWR